MPLILAEEFLGVLQDMRVCHVGGRTGGFKTGVSVRIFPFFAQRGYRLVSNMSCVWNTPLEEWTLCDDGMLHTFMILDEGGLYLDSRFAVRSLTAYLAKFDIILVIPSYEEPHRRARVINVRPIFRLFHMGLPLVIYKWWMKPQHQKKEDKGFFGWLDPSEVYGVYSRQDPGDDLEDIIATLDKRARERKTVYGHKAKSLSLPTVSLLGSGGGEIVGLASLADEIEEITDSARADVEAIFERTNDLYRKIKRP